MPDKEVNQTDNISSESQKQDNIEDPLPGPRAPRGIVSRLQRSAEGLVLRLCERGDAGGIVPEVDEGGIGAAHEKGAAGEHGEGFGDGGEEGVEGLGGGDELSEEARIGGCAVGDAGVEADGCGPFGGDGLPVSDDDAVGGVGVGVFVG